MLINKKDENHHKFDEYSFNAIMQCDGGNSLKLRQM